jgi:hypothetical protein
MEGVLRERLAPTRGKPDQDETVIRFGSIIT